MRTISSPICCTFFPPLSCAYPLTNPICSSVRSRASIHRHTLLLPQARTTSPFFVPFSTTHCPEPKTRRSALASSLVTSTHYTRRRLSSRSGPYLAIHPSSRQQNRMSSPSASSGSASTASPAAQSQYQDRLTSMLLQPRASKTPERDKAPI